MTSTFGPSLGRKLCGVGGLLEPSDVIASGLGPAGGHYCHIESPHPLDAFLSQFSGLAPTRGGPESFVRQLTNAWVPIRRVAIMACGPFGSEAPCSSGASTRGTGEG